MKVDCALLCDAVTIREGLLHVLGGGITRAARPTFPAPLGLALALRILIHPTETGSQHSGKVVLQSQDGENLVSLDFLFEADPAGLSEVLPGELLSLPLALPLQGVGVPRAGGYSFEILLDGSHHASIPFQMQVGGAV